MQGSFPSRTDIAARQLAQVRRLLAANLPANRFYQNKLAGAPAEVSSLDDFFRFPFTTKQELSLNQREFPPYGTNLSRPLTDYTRFHQTSGTTSAPLRWLDTPESWQAMVESWKAIYLAAGVGRGERIYFAFSFGPFIGFWLAFDAAAEMGCLCLPGGGLGSEARARAIIDNKATVLCCTPGYAARLAEAGAAAGLPLSSAQVRVIIVAGEPGGSIPATRRRLEALWPGALVFDHHGMTETGPMSHQCPAQPGRLHILESAYLPEVLDSAGQPVAAGQTGELVVTTLERTASPLLRYRTGDLVRAALPPNCPCACGRYDLALDGGILGRVDDMVIVRGVNIFPSAVEEIMRSFPEIAEYQALVDQTRDLPELSLRIEPAADVADAQELARRAQGRLHSAFNLRVPVEMVPPGSLPRFEMKARRWTVRKPGV